MLNFNFLNNLQYWGEALQTIETRLPHKLSDFRQSLSPTHMEASIWMIEEVKNYLEEYYLKTGSMRVLILNSWLGLPIVPLLCENIDVSQIHMVDIDDESIELSKLFNKHYSQDKFVNIRHISNGKHSKSFHVLLTKTSTKSRPSTSQSINLMRPALIIFMCCAQKRM